MRKFSRRERLMQYLALVLLALLPGVMNSQGLMALSAPGTDAACSDSVASSQATDSSAPEKAGATARHTKWTISLTPKASLQSGTQTQQVWGGQFVGRRETPTATAWHHQMTTAEFDANNSLAEQIGSQSIRTYEYDGQLSHAIYVAPRAYLHFTGAGYVNSSLNLYLEQSYGGGFGGSVLKTNSDSIEITADLLFMGEHFIGTTPGLGFAGAGISERISHVLAVEKGGPIEIAEGATWLPAFSQKKAWQVRGLSDLSIPINKMLSMNLEFADDYMENAPNARKNYSNSSVGVTFTFPAR